MYVWGRGGDRAGKLFTMYQEPRSLIVRFGDAG